MNTNTIMINDDIWISKSNWQNRISTIQISLISHQNCIPKYFTFFQTHQHINLICQEKKWVWFRNSQNRPYHFQKFFFSNFFHSLLYTWILYKINILLHTINREIHKREIWSLLTKTWHYPTLVAVASVKVQTFMTSCFRSLQVME